MATGVARIFLSILIYCALVALVTAIKPAFLFTEDGTFKAPGLTQDGTHSIMAAPVFFPLMAMVVYYGVAL
jgi:hypothetical protein